MHSWQNARIMYMVKNGSQHNIKPPTMIASVLAAFVSIRNRFACTLNMRLPTPLIVLLVSSTARLLHSDAPMLTLPPPSLPSNWLQSIAVALPSELPHKNDSMFSLRFSVICIMWSMGLLLVISTASPEQSDWICFGCALAKYSRRCSSEVVPMLFDGFRCVPGNGGDIRGTLFDRLPRCMRNVSRVSSNRFCFDEPANWAHRLHRNNAPSRVNLFVWLHIVFFF